jgi:hypothetical protein
MATATHILKTRVTPETKRIVEAVARQQELTESAWLRRLIDTTLQSAGAVVAPTVQAHEGSVRTARLTIRLLSDDQLLLRDRAAARAVPAATYASMLLRAHLRSLAPLPREELRTLRRSVAELAAVGRNLNQLARAANQGGRGAGPTREELRALLRACEGLRDHVRQLVEANLRSWEAGHAEARR